MLVKIPHTSTHNDWDGTKYILFNSSYSATQKTSLWDSLGILAGSIVKLPIALIYWNGIDALEDKLLGTVYPFKWDVKECFWCPGNEERGANGQVRLLRTPNILGGRIVLNDTDKIKYSKINALINAENNFIKMTRQAQSGKLKDTMGLVEEESEVFGDKVRENLKESFKALDVIKSDQSSQINLEEKQTKQEEDKKTLQKQRNETGSAAD
jgi:hypothetical protein